jgi:predicted  nucleic acid-binding Zn-ribbon protein
MGMGAVADELDQDLLRELHRIHRQATELRERIARGPRQVLATETKLNTATAAWESAKDKKRKTRMLADEKQLLMQQREARIDKLQGNLNTAETNKEFQTLKDQIGAEKQANEVLADEIFELLERSDVEQELIVVAAAAVETAKQENAEIAARVAEQKTQLETDLARVEGLLAEAETRIVGKFKDDYKRLVKRKGGPEAFAEVVDECCGACYQTLTPQIFNNLYMSKPVFCTSCGCVLYLPENHKVK